MGETEVVTKAKVETKTAVYKVHVHCGQCQKDIEREFTEFHGVEEVKVDAGAGKVTVKGFGFDAEKLRAKVEKGCRKKVELIPPPKDTVVTEVKTMEQELKVITVKVPLHCPECAVRVQEILLEHKSIYAAKTDHGKNTCVVEGVIDEKKLIEYIYQRTRKLGTVEKVEKKVIVKEEKIVEVKKVEETKKGEVAKVVKEKVVTDVVAPYFIPCTHPHFVDYSHPCHRRCGGDYCPPPYAGCGYPPYGGGCVRYTYSELKDCHQGTTAFLHCSHPCNEFISEENPYACSVM